MRRHGEARALEHRRDLAREHRALVRGHAERAVERRGAVAVEPHERIHPVGIEGDEAPLRAQHAGDLGGAARGIGEMMHHAAQQHAVEARVGKRQVLDVAFDEFDLGIFAPSDREQLGADVEPDAVVAGAREQRVKAPEPQPRSATRAPGSSPLRRTKAVDQARARLRREHVVVVRRRMARRRTRFPFACLVAMRNPPALINPRCGRRCASFRLGGIPRRGHRSARSRAWAGRRRGRSDQRSACRNSAPASPCPRR